MSLLNKTGESEFNFPKFNVEPNSYEAKIIQIKDPKQITNTYDGKETKKWNAIIDFELPLPFKEGLHPDIKLEKIHPDNLKENVTLSYFFSLGKIKPKGESAKSKATKAFTDLLKMGSIILKDGKIADESEIVKIVEACDGNEELERNIIVDFLRKKLVGQTARIQTDINTKGFAKIDKVLVWVLSADK